jgi:hypothetical protein
MAYSRFKGKNILTLQSLSGVKICAIPKMGEDKRFFGRLTWQRCLNMPLFITQPA